MPAGWDIDLSDEYEWVPLRLPPDVTRVTASTRLSIEAEYRGWELTKVRLYTDGSRRVLLRRKKSRVPQSARRRSAGARRCTAVLRRALFLVPPGARPHPGVRALRGVTAGAPVPAGSCDERLGPADPVLASTVFGVRFPGPMGLAAGFDKDGIGLDTWGAMGFGYAEIGTVTAQPQPGNPHRGCSGCPPTVPYSTGWGSTTTAPARWRSGWPATAPTCRSG